MKPGERWLIKSQSGNIAVNDVLYNQESTTELNEHEPKSKSLDDPHRKARSSLQGHSSLQKKKPLTKPRKEEEFFAERVSEAVAPVITRKRKTNALDGIDKEGVWNERRHIKELKQAEKLADSTPNQLKWVHDQDSDNEATKQTAEPESPLKRKKDTVKKGMVTREKEFDLDFKGHEQIEVTRNGRNIIPQRPMNVEQLNMEKAEQNRELEEFRLEVRKRKAGKELDNAEREMYI